MFLNRVQFIFGCDSDDISKEVLLDERAMITVVHRIDIESKYCQLMLHRYKESIHVNAVTPHSIFAFLLKKILCAVFLRLFCSGQGKSVNEENLLKKLLSFLLNKALFVNFPPRLPECIPGSAMYPCVVFRVCGNPGTIFDGQPETERKQETNGSRGRVLGVPRVPEVACCEATYTYGKHEKQHLKFPGVIPGK